MHVEPTAAPEMTAGEREAPRLPQPGSPTVARTTPALPPLAPLDRRTVSAVRRGRRDIEGVIDLHGMRQNQAHDALRGFLHRSQGAGHKLVLVITGKGAPGTEPGSFEERGVLRRVVPPLAALAGPAAAGRRLRGSGAPSWGRRRPLRAAPPRDRRRGDVRHLRDVMRRLTVAAPDATRGDPAHETPCPRPLSTSWPSATRSST